MRLGKGKRKRMMDKKNKVSNLTTDNLNKKVSLTENSV